MKKTIQSAISFLLMLVLIVCAASCGGTEKNLWESATYSENTELGSGAKTLVVEVKAGEKTVTFTVKTDCDTVGAALLEQGLVTGETGQYGLYIKSVNGITADYDRDGAYWAFYVNGEYAMTGVDGTEITEGDLYQLAYTKG